MPQHSSDYLHALACLQHDVLTLIPKSQVTRHIAVMNSTKSVLEYCKVQWFEILLQSLFFYILLLLFV